MNIYEILKPYISEEDNIKNILDGVKIFHRENVVPEFCRGIPVGKTIEIEMVVEFKGKEVYSTNVC